MKYKYTFTKENGARVSADASTMSGALEKACLVGDIVTCVREPLGNDIARPVVADRPRTLEHYSDNPIVLENHQLKARVARLEDGLQQVLDTGYRSVAGKIVDKLLNEAPAQSLSAIKAEALEEADRIEKGGE